MDNRFAYMRKHLGISQKEASVIFGTRLDTIKKWDSNRLWVPQSVLEELYDLVRFTRTYTAKMVKKYKAIDAKEGLDELYLHIPDIDVMALHELPQSQGWVDRVIGGLIGDLAMFHVYAAKNIPKHADLGFQWYEFWELEVGQDVAVGFAAVQDEAAFVKDLEQALADESFKVMFSGEDSHYYLGFMTTAIASLGNEAETVWIKACHGGRHSEMFSKSDLDIRFHAFDDSEVPYILDNDDHRENVGLLLDGGVDKVDCDDDKSLTDCYSLGALIFEKLAARYKTTPALLTACRRVSGDELAADDDNWDVGVVDWSVTEKRFLSQRFLVTLWTEFRDQTGRVLLPEGLIEVCRILIRSEPALEEIDLQEIVIDTGRAEITVMFDLRDIIDADQSGKTYDGELNKAVEVIKSVIDGGDVSTMPAFSKITAILTEDDEDTVKKGAR